jgi:hypothetical protein
MAMYAEDIIRDLEEENTRLRAELEENTGVMCVLRRQRNKAEDTISRVRGLISQWRMLRAHGSAATELERTLKRKLDGTR